MQVSISARHGHLSTATQDKIHEKVERLQKYHDRVSSIQVTADLGVREDHHDAAAVEIRVKAERADDFVATETAENLFAALDGAIDKVESQLRKHREKVIGHRTTGLKHLEATLEADKDAE